MYFSGAITNALLIPKSTSIHHQSKSTYELNLDSIMYLMYYEKTSKEIAAICNLSCRTVEDYRKKILRITNSINMAGIIKYVVEKNIHNNEYLKLKFKEFCTKVDLEEIDSIR
jgi:DNA-binding CsgD family transcriptional regulator